MIANGGPGVVIVSNHVLLALMIQVISDEWWEIMQAIVNGSESLFIAGNNAGAFRSVLHNSGGRELHMHMGKRCDSHSESDSSDCMRNASTTASVASSAVVTTLINAEIAQVGGISIGGDVKRDYQ